MLSVHHIVKHRTSTGMPYRTAPHMDRNDVILKGLDILKDLSNVDNLGVEKIPIELATTSIPGEGTMVPADYTNLEDEETAMP